MNGTVSFRSKDTAGSTFGFRIPLHQRYAQPMTPGQSDSSYHTATSAPGPLGFLPSFLQDRLTPGGTRQSSLTQVGLEHCDFFIFSRGIYFKQYLKSMCVDTWHARRCIMLHEERNKQGRLCITVSHEESTSVSYSTGTRHQKSIFLVDLGAAPEPRHDRSTSGAYTPSSTGQAPMALGSVTESDQDLDEFLEALESMLLERLPHHLQKSNYTIPPEERDVVVLLYSFGQASRVYVPPTLYDTYNVRICRKPVTERELLALLRHAAQLQNRTEAFYRNIPKRTLSPSRLQLPQRHRRTSSSLNVRSAMRRRSRSQSPPGGRRDSGNRARTQSIGTIAASYADDLPVTHAVNQLDMERCRSVSPEIGAAQLGGNLNLRKSIDKRYFDELRARLQREVFSEHTSDKNPTSSTKDVEDWVDNVVERRSESDPASVPESKVVPPTNIVPPATQGSGRVLVVDDNAINRSLLCRQLARLDVTNVDTANNGEEACAMFQPGRYELVIMDLRMPRMNGYTAAQVMREKERSWIHDATSASDAPAFCHCKHDCANTTNTHCCHDEYHSTNQSFCPASPRATIVALTADIQQSYGGAGHQDVRQNGMDLVLVKPISLRDLTDLLRSHLSTFKA
jgi:CheY-like chemotaxis protein